MWVGLGVGKAPLPQGRAEREHNERGSLALAQRRGAACQSDGPAIFSSLTRPNNQQPIYNKDLVSTHSRGMRMLVGAEAARFFFSPFECPSSLSHALVTSLLPHRLPLWGKPQNRPLRAADGTGRSGGCSAIITLRTKCHLAHCDV